MRRLTSRRQSVQLITGLAVICASVVCLLSVHAFAAPKPTGFDSTATSGLEISPALIELNGEPGKSYFLKFKIHNVTAGDLTYSPLVNDFAAKDETGTPKFLIAGDLPPNASMISWITIAPQFTLKKQEIREVTMTVTIPKGVEPGGHYGVVNFSGKDPLTINNSVGVKVNTGLLVLIRVAGAVDEKLTLASLTTEQDKKQSTFFEKAPINFVTRIKNEGNVHVKPVGTIEVRDMFGSIVSTLKVNEKTANVLPNSTRRFESELGKDWMIGRYTATLTMGYGTTGQVLGGQVDFWVIPYKIILAVLGALATLIFIMYRLIKVHNRHVIEKYKKSNGHKTEKHEKE